MVTFVVTNGDSNEDTCYDEIRLGSWNVDTTIRSSKSNTTTIGSENWVYVIGEKRERIFALATRDFWISAPSLKLEITIFVTPIPIQRPESLTFFY